MAQVLILGAGLGGLSTATMLARDGHQVTVVDRDPAAPPDRAVDAWDSWERPGVNQFRLAHFMHPWWWAQLRAELPEAADALAAAGATRINMLAALPVARRGELRPDDDRFETVTARRPVLEAVLAGAAEAAGVQVRRGVRVVALVTDGAAGVPRVLGVRTADGPPIPADLVVDCSGRRSGLAEWLVAVGAREPAEERADCGFVYYGRHFRSRTGALPESLQLLQHNYDSLTILTLPGDNHTWSVVLITSARDKELRALRDPATWCAALARYPLAAHWADGEPISGVDVMAGIEDRYRNLFVDGQPVATGVIAAGDAWACTNPSLGRGSPMALAHGRLVRDLLRDVDAADHAQLAAEFGQRTAQSLEPWYRATVWYDGHRLAEIDADIAGTPYATEDPRWRLGKALYAAALVDPELVRDQCALSGMLSTPDQVFARPGVLDRVLALAADAPRYPLPGPTRTELLATIHNGLQRPVVDSSTVTA